MFLTGKCKICDKRLVFDIGDTSIEESKKYFDNTEMGECPGFHVEFGSWSNYYDIDYKNIYPTSKEAKDANLALNIA